MIAFVSIAAAMVVAALVWVLVPLLRGPRARGVVGEASNVAILRDQLAELDNDVANGIVSRDQYEQSRRELEQRVLEESKAAPGSAGSGVPSSAAAWTAAIVGGALPIAAVVLYFALGSPQAFAPGSMAAAGPRGGDAQHDMSPQKVAEMAASLAAKLEKDPGNADGWATLAHTYYSLQRFSEAVAAYERAVKLLPDNADLLADYADALGAATNSLDGKPTELIERALKADPMQWKALALAGTVAFNRKDYAQAVVLLGAAEGDAAARIRNGEVDRWQHRRSAAAGRHHRGGGAARARAPPRRVSRRWPPRRRPPPRRRAGDRGGDRRTGRRPRRHGHAEPGAGQVRRAGGHGVHRRPRVGGPALPAGDRPQAGEGPAVQVHAGRLDGDVAGDEDVQFRRPRRRRARQQVRQRRRRRAATSRASSKPVKMGTNGISVVIDSTRP